MRYTYVLCVVSALRSRGGHDLNPGFYRALHVRRSSPPNFVGKHFLRKVYVGLLSCVAAHRQIFLENISHCCTAPTPTPRRGKFVQHPGNLGSRDAPGAVPQ